MDDVKVELMGVSKDSMIIGYVDMRTPPDRLEKLHRELVAAASGAKAVVLIENSVRLEAVAANPVVLIRVPKGLDPAGMARMRSALGQLQVPGVSFVVVREGQDVLSLSDEALEAAGLRRIVPQ